MERRSDKKIVVIKLGGSVLVNEKSYEEAARFLARRLQTGKASEGVPGKGSPERHDERLVAVVSARKGVTNELERLARNTTPNPNPGTLDLLWSTGEIHSVALLTLHLEKLGVSAVGLNVHQVGLRSSDSGDLGFAWSRIENILHEHAIAVIPGFFGTDHTGAIRSLGRGGSDLTAVLLAATLQARQCELVKDVPGYFAEDPKLHRGTRHLDHLSYQQALAMAAAGCDLVQRTALEVARRGQVRLVVRAMDDTGPASIVSDAARDA
jgi:aspartate kinase